MIAPHYPPGAAALAARWREDAQVLRRYRRKQPRPELEQMAAELEASTAADVTATVALSVAAELSGFTRAHLRRLIREGKLDTAGTEGREPQVRLSDLPWKATHGAPAQLVGWPSTRAIVAEVVGTGCARPPRPKNRKVPA
jgi:hypothetical protein